MPTGVYPRKAAILRFEEKFMPVPETGCWIWLGAHSVGAYGTFEMDGRCEKSHIAAYLLYIGPIPEESSVLHHCDVKLCVNCLLYTSDAADE